MQKTRRQKFQFQNQISVKDWVDNAEQELAS